MRSLLRFRPLIIWLLVVLAGFILAVTALLGHGLPRPRPVTGNSVRALSLEDLVPDLLTAARAPDGAARPWAAALARVATTEAHTLEAMGHSADAMRYRQVARWAQTITDTVSPEERLWRAEVLASAVRGLGSGVRHPVPAAAWAGPPTTSTTLPVPPAVERVRDMARWTGAESL